MALAVAVTLAIPIALVVAVAAPSVAEAPLPGTANTTVIPESGLPDESTTSAFSGSANAVLTAVVWPLPLETEIVDGGTNAADTARSALIASVQVGVVPAAAQAPPQPVNVPPATADAVSTT